ncbi:hypothetical protein AB3A93_002113 [Vibrio parahaemolyticus]|uniref:asparagine synthase (glutamine-hydrolyzing) n=1 Tax=Vibrio parahaemolyticus TaxID=670 RepID=A0A7M1WCJ4_VIBPH|nr:asparagine synthase-related protein [Vibrio parahaemolyticus]ELA7156570.1 hypothetical protein [Vibrio parahaemolyticus]ELB2919088.1 hypothetical protein [Vibrio parahaemolyticus]MCR9851996.1 asparagine synthase-related protein [Vibrio parahaemolyticus]MDF4398129.1 asparagine synthase-related protein [Vibrio parahaemolyticus]MDF4733196.1 asparagine synthase-related protein [Vibrio parahaemolyticus]
MFKDYNGLGSRSYYRREDASSIYSSLEECLHSSPSLTPYIDGTAILSILMKNYSIGNRTLIKGVQRTPWMSYQNEKGLWENLDLPRHGDLRVEPQEASKVLYQHLISELGTFLSNKTTVGVLLSGGMDSRIVAGVLRQLQKSGDYSGDVVAITWGIPESRDVIYAKRIANEFGWSFEHFELNAERLLQNIELSATRGAEYSPIHLHAMEAVSKLEGLEGVLAGSYGDSIGRGEYSGRRYNKLPGILDKHLNHFAFLNKAVENQELINLKHELAAARERFPGRSEAEYREIEMQLHYMRRQLNACMEVIDDNIPLYQMFSSPSTFGYMWSLSKESRTDDVYEHLLKYLPSILSEIPWARTGKIYNSTAEMTIDNNSSLNNRYGEWLRNDLRSEIRRELLDGTLQSLGIFNEKALVYWADNWGGNNEPKADRLDEKVAWLASLSLFCKRYNIKGNNGICFHSGIDYLNLAKAVFHTKIYHSALKFKNR